MSEERLVLTENIDGITKVTLFGKITADNDYCFKMKLEEILSKTSVPNYIVNMGECTYINSKGIGILAMMLKNVKKSNGNIVFYALLPPLMRLFEVTRLVDVFVIKDDDESALAYFKN